MFSCSVDGADIVFSGVATCFAGKRDIASGQDNGIGAWGFPTGRFAYEVQGGALPVRGVVPSLANSPLPASVPRGWLFHVFLPSTRRSTWVSFLDYGPTGGLSSGACCDLLPAVVAALGYVGDPEDFEEDVEVRLPGLAHLLAVK